MIKTKLTPNYGGVRISGDYYDLNELYDAVAYLINYDAKSIEEEAMQDHLYGFMYDVRHAYQGDREIMLVDNGLYDSKREWFGIKKRDATDNAVYYEFDYLWPDLLLDIMLAKYFIKKVDIKENDIYNSNINLVNYFYAIVLDKANEFLSSKDFKKVRDIIKNNNINEKKFLPQWFELLALNYAKMSKQKRKKEFMQLVDKIYCFLNYDEYINLQKEITNECKANNCNICDIDYDDCFPREITF